VAAIAGAVAGAEPPHARGEDGEKYTMDDGVEADRITAVPALVARLYRGVDELESVFPGRHFTPDGHLVGSLGEGLAAYAFDLELETSSNEGFDATAENRWRVEIKTTQGKGVALSATANPPPPDHLLVLHLDRTTLMDVVYNGLAKPAWAAAGPPGKNGQRRISLRKLAKMQEDVRADDRLVQIREMPTAAVQALAEDQ